MFSTKMSKKLMLRFVRAASKLACTKIIAQILTFCFISVTEALKIHKEKRHSVFFCSKCPEHKGFNRKSSLNAHVKNVHEGVFPSTRCTLCHKNLETEEKATSHFKNIINRMKNGNYTIMHLRGIFR